MKNIAILSALLCILYSCSKDTEPLPDLVPHGTWKLIGTHGQVPNSESTGAQMEFQETYKLNSNGTFLKEREQEGIFIQAKGTYILQEENTLYGVNAILVINMTYEERNSIIASCTSSQLVEDLYFTKNHRMLSTWHACDGMELEYAKVK